MDKNIVVKNRRDLKCLEISIDGYMEIVTYIKRPKYKCNGTYEYAIPPHLKSVFGDICGHWVYPYSKFVKFVIYSNYFSKRYQLNDTMLTSKKDN